MEIEMSHQKFKGWFAPLSFGEGLGERPAWMLIMIVWLWAGTQVQGQSLDSLRTLLRENNPELRAMALDYRAALAVSPQLSQLPDLEIGGGVSILPVETRLGPQRARVMVTQMLPWPGTLAAMSTLADAQAQPVLEQAAARQLDLLYQLDNAYFDVVTAAEKITALDTSLMLYTSLQRLALARVENSRGSSVEVYQTELQLSSLRRQINRLKSEQQLAWVTIEALVNESLPRVAVPTGVPVVPTLPVSLDFADYPLVRIFALQEEVSRRILAVNALEARPDFGIGVDYIATGKRTDAEPPGNGRDAILPRVMLRVPLSGGRFRAKREEESIRVQAIAARRESVTDQLTAAIGQADIARREAAAREAYLQQQSTTLAAALTIARSEYANGRRPFDELLRLHNEYVDYQLETIDARRSLLTQIATLNRYLPRR